MATIFKTLSNNDIATTKMTLHEAIPITGSIVSGTYNNENIRNYSHGMFQSVYDYPYLSSSANHIYDLTVGYAADSGLADAANNQNTKKINIYNQMAQVLNGFDATGSIRVFDQDGDYTGGTKMRECFFINFARLLYKDEIKKGSFRLNFYTDGTPAALSTNVIIGDYDGIDEYRINSPSGDYGILYTGSAAVDGTGVGLLYYQAGVAVLTASLVVGGFGDPSAIYDTSTVEAVITGSAISASCDGIRNRWKNLDFNNTTELNSTIYFCRMNHSEFNYSSNPTYLNASKLRVKNNTWDQPKTYPTTVGLYSADNQLLATAKLSEPIKKTPESELTIRVRLDY
tara:strand:+ start:108 stop:1133 length:1026 start_codon:yes stop_codon:yes gene_type:complete